MESFQNGHSTGKPECHVSHAAIVSGGGASGRAMAFTLCRRGSNPRTDLAIGSDGGASGRAKAFCLCRPGSNPRTDFGFFGSELLFIYSQWAFGFL